MAEARLNFADHPDGSFSCQAVWHGDYTPASLSHQNVRILEEYIGSIREAIPDDLDEDEAASRPTLKTEASMHFTDEGGGCRLRMRCTPKADSPAYIACMKALRFFEFINQASSDALATRSDGVAVVVRKEVINGRNNN